MLAHTVRVTTLDERTGALLERLERLCPGGGYHIFEAADLAPDSEEEIAEAICYLSDSHCVDVRYAEGGTYCLRVLPAGMVYAQQARERAKESDLRNRRTAIFAFCGAFAGGLLAALIAAVVVLIVK